jgi:hypothetical protein
MALSTKSRQGFIDLSGTNTLAYYKNSKIMGKFFITLGPGRGQETGFFVSKSKMIFDRKC